MSHRRGKSLLLLLALLLLGVGLAAQEADDEGLDAIERLRLADALFRREIFETAAKEYETFVTAYPEHEKVPAALLAWASCHPRDPDQAIPIYRRLWREHSASEAGREGALRLLPLLLLADEVAEAAELAGGADPEAGDEAWREGIWYFRGVIANRRQETAAAAEHFAKIADKPISPEFPYRAYARLHLAFLRRAEDPAAATTLLAAIVGEASVPGEVREEALFYLGEIARNREDHDAARTHFRRLLEAHPAGAYAGEARVRLAWVERRAGNYREVIELLTPAAGRLLPDTPEVLYLRSDSQMQLKLYDAARQGFQTLAERYPDSQYRNTAELAVLQCLYQSRNYAAAAERAVQVLQMDVSDEVKQETHVILARSYLAREQWREAAEVLESALGRYGREWEHHGAALTELARAYAQAGDHPKAAVAYRRLAALFADDRGSYLLHAAEHELQADNLDRAMTDYTQAHETAGENAEVAALALLGQVEVHLRQEGFREALPRLDAFIERFPEHRYLGRALYLRGNLRYRLNEDRKLTIADLEKAIATGNLEQESFARLLLGSAYWEAGMEDEALRLFALVLDSPDVRSSLAPQVINAIGERYIERNDLVSARRAYQVLEAHDEPTVRLAGFIGLGKVSFAAARWEEAAELFARVRRQATKPEDAEFRAVALAYLGESYRQMGDLDRALLELQESVRLRSDDIRATAMARHGLAQIHAKQGNIEKALRFTMLTYLLEDDPVYSPRAMLLELRLLLDKGDTQAARTTLRELDKRYPIALSAFRNQAENRELFTRLDALNGR